LRSTIPALYRPGFVEAGFMALEKLKPDETGLIRESDIGIEAESGLSDLGEVKSTAADI
jgi:hypothetical protein